MTAPSPRILPVLTLLVIAAALLVVSAPDAHADKKDGRIAFEVTTDPADIGPGQKGTLTIKGILFGKLHIYGSTDEQAMTYVPIKADGVAYDMDKAQISPTHDHKGEFDDEARPVWEKSFTLSVPIELAQDVKAGTKLGVAFTYNGCTNIGCYPVVKNHEAFLVLKAPRQAPVVSKPIQTEEGSVEIKVEEESETKGTIVVIFTPSIGWHFYGPLDDGGSVQVEVKPKESEGVTFGKVKQDQVKTIEGPYRVEVPYTRKKDANKIEVTVIWAGCESGPMAKCNTPGEETMGCVWPGGGGTEPVLPPVTAPKEPIEKGEVLFEVVEDETLDAAGVGGFSLLEFLLIFAGGLGLAFTPCVLPIIPITVSVISGGNADIPRKRLAYLLAIYVLGLCLTFATMGVVAAKTGGAMSALFAMSGVQWGIVVLFIVLGFGMYGVYEMQAPQWLTKFQGGAQKRSGSVPGAFLFGCLGAIIASPCTGPAIAVLLIETAKEGSAILGFTKFFTLGLGMGAVLFAAGSLNFVMRPGPWMTWVRYTFGVLIVAAAFYYLSNYKLVEPTMLWVLAGVVCVLAAAGIAWHLHKKEGEEKAPARVRGIKVAVLTLAAIGLVAWYTRTPDNLLSWTYAKDPKHLQKLVADANEKGQPVVVDFWGAWCTNCKVYDKRIATEPELRQRFERITRIKVDLSEDTVRWPMRHALGVEESGAPVMVFIDRAGRIRRAADLVGLQDSDTVVKHIDLVLTDNEPLKTSAR